MVDNISVSEGSGKIVKTDEVDGGQDGGDEQGWPFPITSRKRGEL